MRLARRRTPLRPWMLAVPALVALAAGVWVAADGTGNTVRPTPAVAQTPVSAMQLLSRPDLRPPQVAVDQTLKQRDRRLIFVSPRMRDAKRDARTHQQGALALDARGRTVWFRPAPDGAPTTEVRVQRYRGKPVLTWWQGAASSGGIGRGEAVIVDQSYRTIATVQAGNGETMDLHEFLLTPRGTALIVIYSRARRDLTAIGGTKDAQVTQGIVQEIDVETGEVLFEWKSLDDVAPSESYRELPTDPNESYDYFHINSVGETADGDLLVSARATSAVYKIDRETGKVVFRLGGKRSDFTMGSGTKFGLQHDARDLGGGVVQIFDNANEADTTGEQTPSSVRRIRLDERRMRATLVDRFAQPDAMWAESQGNAQPLPGGGVMAGWGSTGAFSWLDARGRVLFDAHLPAEYDSYRAYLGVWTGRPDARPALHARRDGGQVTVAASWNGATQVRSWQVLAGPSRDTLEPVGAPAEWRDLETTIVRATGAPYVAVAALDGSGRTLATSAAARPRV